MMKYLYSEKKAFKLYVYYLALKQHFTSDSYDYFKYNGKISAKRDTFSKRNDRFHFYKLSNRDNARELLFSNILHNPNMWIGEIFDESAKEIYNGWKKRTGSLTYLFENDLKKIDLRQDLKTRGGQHPKLLTMYNQNQVMLETLTILDMIIHFFDKWQEKVDDNIILPDINRTVNKYKPFLERGIDISKFRKIVIDKCKT